MNRSELLSLLADGEVHSGERIGEQSGLTRAAVWKQIRKLEKWGLQVESVSGRGYRLSQPVDLLDAQQLHHSITQNGHFDLDAVEVFTETDSTNKYLMANPPSRPGALRLCVAEWQSAGRGRLQRHWVSPLGTGICMSAAWIYEGTPPVFSALSLAAGAAIAQAIAAQCALDIQLKWPNDIVWQGRKLGGVLVESRIESQGQCQVVIGVGLNIAMPEAALARICDWDAGAADLRTAMAGAQCSRTTVAGVVAEALGVMLRNFDARSAAKWLDKWSGMDFLRGKSIRVQSQTSHFDGRADGIDADGALLVVDEAGTTVRVLAGDASVRMS